MPKKVVPRRNMDLYEAILKLKDPQECCDFFHDLCSAAELSAMEQRYEVATLLSAGQVDTDILEKTGASSATISRVNRMLQSGNGTVPELLARAKGSK